MRITPLDIQQKQFPTRFRGFHVEEVSSFLEQIREEIEDLLRENASLKERIQKADEEMQRLWEMQGLLGKMLQDAHQSAEEYLSHARREADLLLVASEERAQKMVREAHDEALRINEEIVDLKMNRKQFHEEMRNLLEQLKNIILQDLPYQHFPSGGAGIRQSNAAFDGQLLSEDQVRVVEGHHGEEGSSETEKN